MTAALPAEKGCRALERALRAEGFEIRDVRDNRHLVVLVARANRVGRVVWSRRSKKLDEALENTMKRLRRDFA